MLAPSFSPVNKKYRFWVQNARQTDDRYSPETCKFDLKVHTLFLASVHHKDLLSILNKHGNAQSHAHEHSLIEQARATGWAPMHNSYDAKQHRGDLGDSPCTPEFRRRCRSATDRTTATLQNW